MAFSSVTSGGGFQLAEAETFHMLPVSHENICFCPSRSLNFALMKVSLEFPRFVKYIVGGICRSLVSGSCLFMYIGK